MNLFKNFKGRVKFGPRSYLHCSNCNGVFLYEKSKNSGFSTVNCIHCACRIGPAVPNDDELGMGAISRFAAVIIKEDIMHDILKVVQKYRKGVHRSELQRKLGDLKFKEKFILQLICLGLIGRTNNGGTIYYLTGRGRAVLKACKIANL